MTMSSSVRRASSRSHSGSEGSMKFAPSTKNMSRGCRRACRSCTILHPERAVLQRCIIQYRDWRCIPVQVTYPDSLISLAKVCPVHSQVAATTNAMLQDGWPQAGYVQRGCALELLQVVLSRGRQSICELLAQGCFYVVCIRPFAAVAHLQ